MRVNGMTTCRDHAHAAALRIIAVTCLGSCRQFFAYKASSARKRRPALKSSAWQRSPHPGYVGQAWHADGVATLGSAEAPSTASSALTCTTSNALPIQRCEDRHPGLQRGEGGGAGGDLDVGDAF